MPNDRVRTNYDYHDHPDGTCECGHHRNNHAYPGAASTMCSKCPCPTYRYGANESTTKAVGK